MFVFLTLLFIGFLAPSIALAADICSGYDSKDTTHTVQTGICYYQLKQGDNPAFSVDSSIKDCGPFGNNCVALPSCSTMTSTDYHKDPNYHNISDEIQHCATTIIGNQYFCCAKDDLSKQTPAAPPPPCVLDKDGRCTQVNTALGSFKTDPGTIVGNILGILLGISGGIAIIIIMIAGYRIMFTQNDPEKLKAARDMITSAIIGLLFIIFSAAIMQVIGVDILHIPGLNR